MILAVSITNKNINNLNYILNKYKEDIHGIYFCAENKDIIKNVCLKFQSFSLIHLFNTEDDLWHEILTSETADILYIDLLWDIETPCKYPCNPYIIENNEIIYFHKKMTNLHASLKLDKNSLLELEKQYAHNIGEYTIKRLYSFFFGNELKTILYSQKSFMDSICLNPNQKKSSKLVIVSLFSDKKIYCINEFLESILSLNYNKEDIILLFIIDYGSFNVCDILNDFKSNHLEYHDIIILQYESPIKSQKLPYYISKLRNKVFKYYQTFLSQHDLLWWDSDQTWEKDVLSKIYNCGYNFIQLPYVGRPMINYSIMEYIPNQKQVNKNKGDASESIFTNAVATGGLFAKSSIWKLFKGWDDYQENNPLGEDIFISQTIKMPAYILKETYGYHYFEPNNAYTLKYENNIFNIYQLDHQSYAYYEDEMEIKCNNVAPAFITCGYGEYGINGKMGYDGLNMIVNDIEIVDGISCHPPGKIIFNTNHQYKYFEADVALNDSAGFNKGTFMVFAGDLLVAKISGVKKGKKYHIFADIDNAKRITLETVTNQIEGCHSLWINPKFIRF